MSDVTHLWVAAQKSKKWLLLISTGLLLFLVGFQVGKITSPYYAAHPIVFSDNGRGDREGLAALEQEGIEKRSTAAKSTTPAPSVASSPNTTEEQAQVAGAQTKAFVGSKNSNLYHHPDCPTAKRIKAENQVWFGSREEATAAGYSPSQCTKEKLGI